MRRAYIPKPDSHQRPLGVPVLEEKIVQWVTAWIFSVIWEDEFRGGSYGFRPGRSPHDALDALMGGIHRKRVNWLLDADIPGFFDHVSPAWRLRFVESRMGDTRVVRLIQQWLKAGVLAEGRWMQTDEGVPQGGSSAPCSRTSIAIMRLTSGHTRGGSATHGEMSSSCVTPMTACWASNIGPKRRSFSERLRVRLATFDLTLHADKTRRLEFGRFAARNRARRGQGKPASFDFLGFTQICGQAATDRFIVRRQTIPKRLRAKLQAITAERRRRLHDPVPQQGRWLRSVLLGHYRYDGVPLNGPALAAFRAQVMRLGTHALRRRSQKSRLTRTRRFRRERQWLPVPPISHPFPWQRLHVTT